MRLNNKRILIIIVVCTLLLFPVVAFTSGALRIGIGFLFVIFFPGYTLISALFPKQDDLGGIERIALSFGLSIAVVPLIGLALNYTPWGIRLYPILISISCFIIITAAIGWYRQQKLPDNLRIYLNLRACLPDRTNMSRFDKILSVILLISIAAGIGCLGYAIALPKGEETFTEFYILGTEGEAKNYPKNLKPDESAELIIGIVNHENQSASYRIKITIDGIDNQTIDIGMLADEEKVEKLVSFVPEAVGEDQKVSFSLYMNNEDKPYFDDPLYLYINVSPS